MPETLSSSDVPAVMAALRDSDIQKPIRQVLRFIIVTGCRPDEAVTMRWTDVDTNTHPWSWNRLGEDASAIPLPMPIHEMLAGNTGSKLGFGGLVFRCEHHEMVDGILHRCLNDVLRRLGLTGGFGDLRAAFDHWCRREGSEGQCADTLQDWARYAFHG